VTRPSPAVDREMAAGLGSPRDHLRNRLGYRLPAFTTASVATGFSARALE